MSEGRQPYDNEEALADLLEGSQSDDNEVELQEVPEPEQEQPAQEEEQEKEEVEEKVTYVTKEDLAVFQAQQEAYAARTQAYFENLLKNIPAQQTQQTQQPAQQEQKSLYADYPGADEDPAFRHIDRLTKENERLNQTITSIAQNQHHYSSNLAWQAVEASRSKLRADFSDFDEVIKPAEVEQMWRNQVSKRNYNAPFAQVMEQEYKVRTWERGRQASDELTKRREEKVSKQASNAAAAKVPSGGAAFQKVEHRLDGNQRGYKDAHAAAMAQMDEAFGGY